MHYGLCRNERGVIKIREEIEHFCLKLLLIIPRDDEVAVTGRGSFSFVVDKQRY